MWFKFFTRKYIGMNDHGFHISNFISIKYQHNFSNMTEKEVQDWGHNGVQNYMLKYTVYGQKISRI